MRVLRVTRGGLDFEVHDEGPENGEPVLLLHGFPQDASSFDRLAALLHQAGLRTLRFDQRGYAAGARPRRVADYGGRALVDDALAVADAAGAGGVHVVGHDWGGSVAWQMAQAAPDRVRTLTVLATPHMRAMRTALLTSDQALRSLYMAAFQIPWLPERVLAPRMMRLLVAAGLERRHAARYARRFAGARSLTGPLNWYRALAPWHRAEHVPARPTRVPTTYVWGNRDVALGWRGAELTADAVEAPYRFVELAASHWLPEEVPDAVAREVIARVGADIGGRAPAAG